MDSWEVPGERPEAVWRRFGSSRGAFEAFSEDPLYQYQWHMEAVGLKPALNATGQELKNIGVAVIDTGGPTVGSEAWNATNFISGGVDFVDSDFDPTDPIAASSSTTAISHGTHVATTISSKNDGSGLNGFPVSSLNIRVLGEDGSGSNSNVTNGILYAAG